MIRILCITLFVACSISQVMAKTPWEQYLDLPNAENANRVLAMSYSPEAKEDPNDYDAHDLAILGLQVAAGDRAAFRLAYRLRNKSDGGLLEDLDAILGHAIRPHPALFLEEMERAKVLSIVLQGLLLMAGLEYTDRPAAHLYELEMRYAAIESVRARNVEQIRQRALKILKSQIDKDRLSLPERLRN